MSDAIACQHRHLEVKARRRCTFTEVGVWKPLGESWRQLSGNFEELGYSVEWHDFTLSDDLEWSRSFHPQSLEICLNLAGSARVRSGRRVLELGDFTTGFYAQYDSSLRGLRRGGQRHRFVTIELSLPFLERHVLPDRQGLHPHLSRLFRSRPLASVSEPIRLSTEQQRVVMSLRHPPVYAAAQRLWYQAKAMELAADVLYRPAPGEELFCQRIKRLNRERVEKVVVILKENLAEPPSLEEIGRSVGCSHCHLSRVFTQEMGKTISAHLRDLRMERAAELLRQGKMNVTQVAMEIGYSSLSHFTTTFQHTFACCPGLYPLKGAVQGFPRHH